MIEVNISLKLVPESTACLYKDKFLDLEVYRHLRTIFKIRNLIGRVPEHVLEVGGGFGSPARLNMLNEETRPALYVVLDIPESLFFSEIYLRHEFGKNAVYYVDKDCVDLELYNTKKIKFILCPLGCENKILSIKFDIIINTGSFGEMSDQWVEFYKKYIEQVDAEFLYSDNYFGQPIDQLHENTNVYCPRLSESWSLIKNTIRKVRGDGRNSAELLFKKNCYLEQPINENNVNLETIFKSIEDMNDLMLPVTILQIMEFYRLHSSPENAELIIKFYVDNCPSFPKETLYLCRELKKYYRNGYKLRSDINLDSLIESLEGKMTSGSASIVRPKLERMIKEGKIQFNYKLS